jgi:hypothetical protein
MTNVFALEEAASETAYRSEMLVWVQVAPELVDEQIRPFPTARILSPSQEETTDDQNPVYSLAFQVAPESAEVKMWPGAELSSPSEKATAAIFFPSAEQVIEVQ